MGWEYVIYACVLLLTLHVAYYLAGWREAARRARRLEKWRRGEE